MPESQSMDVNKVTELGNKGLEVQLALMRSLMQGTMIIMVGTKGLGEEPVLVIGSVSFENGNTMITPLAESVYTGDAIMMQEGIDPELYSKVESEEGMIGSLKNSLKYDLLLTQLFQEGVSTKLLGCTTAVELDAKMDVLLKGRVTSNQTVH